MRFLETSKDGGPESHVTGFFIVEIKPLFSIVLLKFAKGTREAFHSHAFNALTFWLKGKVKEHLLNGEGHYWYAGDLKYTARNCFHKVEAIEDTWALSLRGPWVNKWREFINGKFITLTHGRKVVAEKG
jgi:quercetin dioxygenase-like cupin family protein